MDCWWKRELVCYQEWAMCSAIVRNRTALNVVSGVQKTHGIVLKCVEMHMEPWRSLRGWRVTTHNRQESDYGTFLWDESVCIYPYLCIVCTQMGSRANHDKFATFIHHWKPMMKLQNTDGDSARGFNEDSTIPTFYLRYTTGCPCDLFSPRICDLQSWIYCTLLSVERRMQLHLETPIEKKGKVSFSNRERQWNVFATAGNSSSM